MQVNCAVKLRLSDTDICMDRGRCIREKKCEKK